MLEFCTLVVTRVQEASRKGESCLSQQELQALALASLLWQDIQILPAAVYHLQIDAVTGEEPSTTNPLFLVRGPVPRFKITY